MKIQHLLHILYFQNIEDCTMRNIVRSVANDTLFEGEALNQLYHVFKVSIMS